MAGILDFLQSPDAQLGIGLLAAGGPSTVPMNFGQRLQGTMQGIQADQQQAMRAKLMQSQIDENASQNLLRQSQMGLAQQKQAGLNSFFGGGATNGGGAGVGGGVSAAAPMSAGVPAGLQLRGTPVETIAKLKGMYGIDLMPQWEAVNVPKQFSANSYAYTPGQAAEFLPDPTKGVGFNGRNITMLPGAENLATLAGQQAGATAHAQANWQEATPVYNDQSQKVIRSRADVLGGGYGTEPQMRATAQGDMGANPASLAREVAALRSDLAKVPDARSKQMIQEQIDTLLGQAQKYNVAQAPVSAGNVVELSPQQQADNEASKRFKTGVAEAASGGLTSSRDAAQSASATLQNVQQIRAGMDKALLGPGAKIGVGLMQVGQALGVGGKDSAETLANTRSVIQGLARQELSAAGQMKGQGQITESERGILRRAESGEIDNFTKPELQVLMGALEKTANYRLQSHQNMIDQVKSGATPTDLMQVQKPPAAPVATMRFNVSTGKLEKVQ